MLSTGTMSIRTMYLASGSTPENDTRMVGNILLTQGDKENGQELTLPAELTRFPSPLGSCPGVSGAQLPQIAGRKLAPVIDSESRALGVGFGGFWGYFPES